jgi:hypothetical protein
MRATFGGDYVSMTIISPGYYDILTERRTSLMASYEVCSFIVDKFIYHKSMLPYTRYAGTFGASPQSKGTAGIIWAFGPNAIQVEKGEEKLYGFDKWILNKNDQRFGAASDLEKKIGMRPYPMTLPLPQAGVKLVLAEIAGTRFNDLKESMKAYAKYLDIMFYLANSAGNAAVFNYLFDPYIRVGYKAAIYSSTNPALPDSERISGYGIVKAVTYNLSTTMSSTIEMGNLLRYTDKQLVENMAVDGEISSFGLLEDDNWYMSEGRVSSDDVRDTSDIVTAISVKYHL